MSDARQSRKGGACLQALREILPLAERYLQSAPGHPDNAKLETARALLINGPSTGESPLGSKKPVPAARGMAHRLTKKEKAMVRRAISSLLASEFDDDAGDIRALERALEKLQ